MARVTSQQPVPEAPQGGVRLSVRLFALILGVALPPLMAMGYGLIDVNANALRDSSNQLHLAVAADIRRAIRGELGRAYQELDGVVKILLAPGLGEDTRRIELAGTQISSSRSFDFATLYGPDGTRVDTLKAREVPEPAMPAHLTPARLEALEAGPVAGDVRPWQGGPALEVFMPFKSEGKVLGYVATLVRLEELRRVVMELGEQRLDAKDAVMVVDGERRLVLHADAARALAREEQAGKGLFDALGGKASFTRDLGTLPEYTADDGRRMLGAVLTIPELGWAVAVHRPYDVAYASVGRMRRLVALDATLAALIALLGAVFGARWVTRPVQALVRATREIASRAFKGVDAKVAARGDELGQLGRAMDTMARELSESEVRVVEETRIRAALSRYLSSDVVDLIVADPGRLKLGGERREVTVLFADVCGFTRLSETLPPETIVALLNELFTFATEVVQRRGGIIDKFIGDSVMAVWGTPESHPDDALRAVQAAEDLRRWLDTGNRRWRQKWGVEIQLAMGLHTGHAVAGNVGSDKRMEYTVIGDAVNVAARLESMAQPGQILVSDATRARLSGEAFELRPLGEKALHGRAGRTEVFEVAA